MGAEAAVRTQVSSIIVIGKHKGLKAKKTLYAKLKIAMQSRPNYDRNPIGKQPSTITLVINSPE